MRVEPERFYRVKAVAEALDVSAATIYRAVASGALDAHWFGSGRGAVRIPGTALEDYIAGCAHADRSDAKREAAAERAGVQT